MNNTMEHARRMLNTFRLDNGFWTREVNICAYLFNSPHITMLDRYIIEFIWCGRPIDYSHLCAFACDAFIHVRRKKKCPN